MRRQYFKIALIVLTLAAAACGRRSGGESEEVLSESIGPSEEEMARLQQQLAAIEKEKQMADSLAEVKRKLGEEPVYIINTNYGIIKVKLYNDTPRHRDNFIKLANSGYYNGTLFHRVVKNFMIQGGDPYTRDTTKIDQWGEGGPGYTIESEFILDHVHKKGALAAARRGDIANPMKESHGSQFYIVVDGDACFHLNGDYTVFGEVVEGMKTVELIASAKTNKYDRPLQDVKVISIRLEGTPEILLKDSEEGGQERSLSDAEKLEELKRKYGNLKDVDEMRKEREAAEKSLPDTETIDEDDPNKEGAGIDRSTESQEQIVEENSDTRENR